jgi:hypothetical protein
MSNSLLSLPAVAGEYFRSLDMTPFLTLTDNRVSSPLGAISGQKKAGSFLIPL